jgi:prevent-host-death family protein
MGKMPSAILSGANAMPQPLKLDQIDNLPHKPASDVKKLGWRGVMQTVGREGKVVVTNHRTPEAVIISVAEYDAIRRALREADAAQEPALDALRRSFDERLSSLQTPDAGKRLRDLMERPARLEGQVKAGDTF